MIEDLITAAEAERRRLATLAAESEDKNVVQIEVLYLTKWVRFEISALEIQHVPSEELWRRYLATALKTVHAPAAVVADPVIPDAPQVGAADIGVVDSVA